MSEEIKAPIDEDVRLNDPEYLTVNAFAALVERERQTISYHLTKGRLKPYADEGRLVFNTDGEWRIHQSLTHRIPQKKHASVPRRPAHPSTTIDAADVMSSTVIDEDFASNDADFAHFDMRNETSTTDMLDFMRETMDKFQHMTHELTELKVENERYKLLTTGKDKSIEDLEAQIHTLQNLIHEKDASLKMYQAQRQTVERVKSHLNTIQQRVQENIESVRQKDRRIAELEAQLAQLSSSTSKTRTTTKSLLARLLED